MIQNLCAMHEDASWDAGNDAVWPRRRERRLQGTKQLQVPLGHPVPEGHLIVRILSDAVECCTLHYLRRQEKIKSIHCCVRRSSGVGSSLSGSKRTRRVLFDVG